MDIIERIYQSNINFVENDNFKGVKKIIVDNYSDEAHFVYELLQNADDAQATEITFDLKEDRLIVTHDGRAFSEKDLEGICSISKGTKSDDYTKIGKLGIGFKSVFVYTESPQIFSGEYQFEIRELVLPKKSMMLQ
jgi:HSP90 family molecular chaperone